MKAMNNSSATTNHRFSVAPMLDWTDARIGSGHGYDEITLEDYY